MNEITKQADKPELLTLLEFLNEVNQITEKCIAGINDQCNKLIPLVPYDDSSKPQVSPSGALSDLRSLIEKADRNRLQLANIHEHLRKVV